MDILESGLDEFKAYIKLELNKIEDNKESLYFLNESLNIFLNTQKLSNLNKNKKNFIEENIKNFINPNDNNIVIGQINPIAGNIEHNALKIMKYIKSAENIKAKLIIFPELSLMGYPIFDTIDRFPFIVEENIKWLEAIAKETKNIFALIGFVEKRNEKCNIFGKKYYNSFAVIKEGKILYKGRKVLLPNYKEFNDYRYIEPSKEVGLYDYKNDDKIVSKTLNINNTKYALSICEDCWNDCDFFDQPLYKKDPILMLSKYTDVFINLSASPSRVKKDNLKHNMLSFIAKKYKKPFIYVNQVGATDDIVFDGASVVYGKNGRIIAKAKSFMEQFLIVNIEKNIGKIYDNCLSETNESNNNKKCFSLNYECDLKRTYNSIISGIKNYFEKNGFKRAVLGLSGGLDSSVSAVLLADALGEKNVYGISMPSNITSSESKSDAIILAQNLGINFIEASICEYILTSNNIFKNIFEKIEKNWPKCMDSYTQDNIQARARALILWSIANEFQSTIPIATSDKSELYMGYATINGDMSGGFAPIADVTKTKLFALGKYLNENRSKKNVIPQTILKKRPGAELALDKKTGKPIYAEDVLMPYEFLDEVIFRIENLKESYCDMLESEFLYEKEHNIPQKQKEIWLKNFFNRMSKAIYKWSIMPPSVLVDSSSINKCEYKQPIVSKIDFIGMDEKHIEKSLREI